MSGLSLNSRTPPNIPNPSAKKASTLTQLLNLSAAGVASGVPADILTFPFYRANTVLQTQGVNPTGQQYRGMGHFFSDIIRTGGARDLYRGMPAVLMAAVPGNMLFFSGMTLTKEYLGPSPWAAPISGFAGQFAASLAFVPSSVFSEIQQTKGLNPELQNMSLGALVIKLVKQEGVPVLYRGLFPQMLTFGTCHALAQALSKETRANLSSQGREGLIFDALANTTAYAVSAGVTNPLEVVKKRLQVGDTNRELMPERNAVSASLRIWHEEGLMGFTRGTIARVTWLGLRMGASITGFNVVYAFLNKATQA